MGIIQKQAIKGTVYSYIGVGIGFITTALLFPKFLSTEEIGLLKLLVSFSMLFSQFASLGFVNVINRLFPYFRDKQAKHHGFLFVGLVITTAGVILSCSGLEIFKPLIVKNNIEKSALLVEYFNYLFPLILFTSFYNLFDNYIKVLYDAVFGTMLKELFQRVLILISILLFFSNIIDFKTLVIAYTLSLSLPTIVIFLQIVRIKEFKLRLPDHIFDALMWREIAILSLYGIITGLGSIVVFQIDSILVNKYLGMSLTGVYATTFFFATIIIIPSRPLLKIATTVLAESWKSMDIKNIDLIYKKSTINQCVIGVLLFILLWVNVDNVFRILSPEYEMGKWVIFIVGLKNVLEMTTGMSAIIIQTSEYYKINVLVIVLFTIILLGLDVILIPLIGLNGAALSILIAYIISAFFRFVFLKIKFNLQPFDKNILIIFIIGFVCYFFGSLFKPISNLYYDIILRSVITGGLFSFLILWTGITEDFNKIWRKISMKVIDFFN